MDLNEILRIVKAISETDFEEYECMYSGTGFECEVQFENQKCVLVLRGGDMPNGFCTVRIGSYTEEFAQGSEIYHILEKMALGLK